MHLKTNENYYYLNNNIIRKGKISGINTEENNLFLVSIKDEDGTERVINQNQLFNNMQEIFNYLANEHNAHYISKRPPSLLF